MYISGIMISGIGVVFHFLLLMVRGDCRFNFWIGFNR